MTAKDGEAFPEGWTAFDDPGFVALCGPVYHRTAAGRKAFAFRAEEKHANLLGIVHGGMLVTFADRALSIACRDAVNGARCVTLDLSVQFVGISRIGDIVMTTPEIVRQTRSMVFVRTVLTCEDRPVAAVSGIWKVLQEKAEPAS